MPPRACPSREELSVYIVGKLLADRSEEIDMHLEICPDCQESLETISAKSDTLVSGLHQSRVSGEFLDEPQCQDALLRVQAIACDPLLTAREQLAAASGESDFPRQIGPYRLLAKLGQGGMGTVYQALHTKLDRVVALKLLPEDRMRAPDAVARFEREMKAVGRACTPGTAWDCATCTAMSGSGVTTPIKLLTGPHTGSAGAGAGITIPNTVGRPTRMRWPHPTETLASACEWPEFVRIPWSLPAYARRSTLQT